MFITGATGYLGGVLLFKLLSYCPHIGKIYLLIRGKKGLSPKERLESIKEQVFFKDFNTNGSGCNQLAKVQVIEGDTQEIGKGAMKYRVDHHPADLGWYHFDFKNPLSARFCLGR